MSVTESGEAAWLRVSDSLLRGVGHAMNNRVAALSAVLQVLASDGAGGPLEAALGTEAERLQRAVELLRLLPRRWEAEPEPVRMDDLVRNAMDLLPLHYDLPDLRYRWIPARDLPPILAEPTLLTHLLLLLGTAAARSASSAGAGVVSFRGSSEGESVSVEVAHGEPEEGVLPREPEEGPLDPRAAEALVARLGGELRLTEEPFRATVTVPTLAAARRKE